MTAIGGFDFTGWQGILILLGILLLGSILLAVCIFWASLVYRWCGYECPACCCTLKLGLLSDDQEDKYRYQHLTGDVIEQQAYVTEQQRYHRQQRETQANAAEMEAQRQRQLQHEKAQEQAINRRDQFQTQHGRLAAEELDQPGLNSTTAVAATVQRVVQREGEQQLIGDSQGSPATSTHTLDIYSRSAEGH